MSAPIVPIVPIVPMTPEHCDAVLRFFRELPERDLTFIKEDVTDPATVRSWTTDEGRGRRWVALEGGSGGSSGDDVVGYLAVLPLPGWSDHVGEVRIVVAPGRRGEGLGRELARAALVRAVEAGLTKLVVEVVADQEPVLGLFTGLGFTGEALLRDHIRGRDGELHDLVLLAHHVGDTWSGMATVGVADDLGD